MEAVLKVQFPHSFGKQTGGGGARFGGGLGAPAVLLALLQHLSPSLSP